MSSEPGNPPHTYSRYPSKGKTTLPMFWTHVDCMIYLDVHFFDTAEDTFPLMALGKPAMMLVERCMQRPDVYKGWTVVGPRKLLELQVERWGLPDMNRTRIETSGVVDRMQQEEI